MTTTTSPDVHATPPAAPAGSTYTAAVRSEWTKFRSVRSSIWSVVATSAFTIGLGTLFCWAFLHRDRNDVRELFDPTSRSLRGVFLAQLAIGVLGVLVMTAEYATGMVRTSIAAVPRRGTLLAAKATVLGVVSLAVGVVSTFLAYTFGQAVLHSQHLGSSISDPGVRRAVLLSGVYLAMIALFGLAIGTIVRRTPGAIATLFAVVLIFPLLAQALPTPWNTDVGKLLPFNAGQAMFSVRVDPDLLTPANGFLVFSAWIVGSFGLAAVLLRRRDV
jgi:hypothetical protein